MILQITNLNILNTPFNCHGLIVGQQMPAVHFSGIENAFRIIWNLDNNMFSIQFFLTIQGEACALL